MVQEQVTVTTGTTVSVLSLFCLKQRIITRFVCVSGAGIVTHHVAYTLEVEQALQAVAPSLSMPYWEFGLDPTIYDNFADSPIFDKDWFGENSPANADHSIDDGSVWSTIEMPSGSPYTGWSTAGTTISASLLLSID